MKNANSKIQIEMMQSGNHLFSWIYFPGNKILLSALHILKNIYYERFIA